MEETVTSNIDTTGGRMLLAVRDPSPWRAKALAYLCQDALSRLLGDLHRTRGAVEAKAAAAPSAPQARIGLQPADVQPAEGDTSDTEVGVLTSIYHGKCGRIVLTVLADDVEAAGLLGRVCGSAIEAAVYKTFDDRLRQD